MHDLFMQKSQVQAPTLNKLFKSYRLFFSYQFCSLNIVCIRSPHKSQNHGDAPNQETRLP